MMQPVRGKSMLQRDNGSSLWHIFHRLEGMDKVSTLQPGAPSCAPLFSTWRLNFTTSEERSAKDVFHQSFPQKPISSELVERKCKCWYNSFARLIRLAFRDNCRWFNLIQTDVKWS